MSLGRWSAIAVLSCLAVAVAYLPPQPQAPAPTPELGVGAEGRLNRLNRAYSVAEEQQAKTRLRDSLRLALRVAPRRGDVQVFIRGKLPEPSQRAFRSGVERVWQRVHTPAGARLVVLLDVKPHRPYQPTYILPEVLDGRTCVSSVILDWGVDWLRDRSAIDHGTSLQPWLLEALGPCLFYGAFGQPGPHIRDWLEERWFTVANTADWNAAAPTLSVHEEPQLFDQLFSDMSFDAVACTDGRLPRCREAVEYNNEGNTLLHRRLAGVSGVIRRVYWPRNFPADFHYLAALVHDMGRERFERFWRSPAPLDSAFAAAFGQPIETWTAHWARGFVPDFPPFGPAPRPSAVLYGFALAAIAVAVTLTFVTRRQVS